jgi:hypothetical protein
MIVRFLSCTARCFAFCLLAVCIALLRLVTSNLKQIEANNPNNPNNPNKNLESWVVGCSSWRFPLHPAHRRRRLIHAHSTFITITTPLLMSVLNCVILHAFVRAHFDHASSPLFDPTPPFLLSLCAWLLGVIHLSQSPRSPRCPTSLITHPFLDSHHHSSSRHTLFSRFCMCGIFAAPLFAAPFRLFNSSSLLSSSLHSSTITRTLLRRVPRSDRFIAFVSSSPPSRFECLFDSLSSSLVGRSCCHGGHPSRLFSPLTPPLVRHHRLSAA